jgi:AAA domain-containing protein
MAPTESQREGSSPQGTSEGRDSRPLRTVGVYPEPSAKRAPRGNLPVETSTFVGRERELSEARELLAETRLLTLTGPGGCGKTRLALRMAREAAGEFGNGVWWVDLTSVSDPDLVAQAVARVMGVREVPGRPLLGLLIEHLESGETLLVLDNCGHVIEACAALVDALLEGCPGLKVLATSRESLRLYGEVSWLVPSLPVPEEGAQGSEDLARNEAVRLFAERARAVSPGFAFADKNAPAVASVCGRLDGMPLAIELAAASMRVLSPHQLLRRLDDRARAGGDAIPWYGRGPTERPGGGGPAARGRRFDRRAGRGEALHQPSHRRGAPALDLQEARGALAGRGRQSSGRARSYLGPCRRFRATPYSSAKPSSSPGCMVGREQKRRRDKDGEGASTRDSP